MCWNAGHMKYWLMRTELKRRISSPMSKIVMLWKNQHPHQPIKFIWQGQQVCI